MPHLKYLSLYALCFYFFYLSPSHASELYAEVSYVDGEYRITNIGSELIDEIGYFSLSDNKETFAVRKKTYDCSKVFFVIGKKCTNKNKFVESNINVLSTVVSWPISLGVTLVTAHINMDGVRSMDTFKRAKLEAIRNDFPNNKEKRLVASYNAAIDEVDNVYKALNVYNKKIKNEKTNNNSALKMKDPIRIGTLKYNEFRDFNSKSVEASLALIDEIKIKKLNKIHAVYENLEAYYDLQIMAFKIEKKYEAIAELRKNIGFEFLGKKKLNVKKPIVKLVDNSGFVDNVKSLQKYVSTDTRYHWGGMTSPENISLYFEQDLLGGISRMDLTDSGFYRAVSIKEKEIISAFNDAVLSLKSKTKYTKNSIKVSETVSCSLPSDYNNYDIDIDCQQPNIKPKYRLKETVITYNVNSLKIDPVIPAEYNNSNNDIKVWLEGDKLYLQNLTSEFMKVNAVSIYLNDKISSNINTSIELPPVSFNHDGLSVTNLVDDLIRRHGKMKITKSQGLLNFGVAVKYIIGNQSQENTLFSQNPYSIHDLLKRKI